MKKKACVRASFILAVILSFVMLFGICFYAFGGTKTADAETVTSQQEETVENSSWYNIGYDNGELAITLNADPASWQFKKSDIADIKNRLLDAVQVLIIDRLFGNVGETEPYAISLVSNDIIPDDSILAKYEKYIEERLKQPGELDKYLNGEYDVLIKYAVSQFVETYPDVDIQEVIPQVQDVVDSVINEVYKEEPDKAEAAKDLNSSYVQNVVQDIEENGPVSITPADIINSLTRIGVSSGNVDVTLFSNDKFSVSAIKKLLTTIPKPYEISNSDVLELRYDIFLGTKFGDAEFELKLGFTGDISKIKVAARFIADHIDVVNDNGVYKVNITVPDEFAKVLAKVSNSPSVPDKVKRAIFAMADKTGSELMDKASGYSLETLLGYLRSVDFERIFSNILNADYIKGYLGAYVNLQNFDNGDIDRILNRISDYGSRLSALDVKEVEDFLKSIGIPGIPSQAEGYVQKFLDMLGKINFENYDAAGIRDFLTDNDRILGVLDRFESPKVKTLYDRFVNYAERLFNALPQKLHTGKLINTYKGDGLFNWQGEVNVDIKNAIEKVTSKLGSYEGYAQTVLSYFDDVKIDYSVNISVSIPNLNKITYNLPDKTVTGLLPQGADMNFYAGVEEIEGYRIVAWIDGENNVYPVEAGKKIAMPAEDITLRPVTEIGTAVTISDAETIINDNFYEREYNGNPITLTAEVIGGYGYDAGLISWKWYKISANNDRQLIEEAVSPTLTLTDVADSGEYLAVAEYSVGDISLTSEAESAVNIVIKTKNVSFAGASWDYDEPFEYDGDPHRVSLLNAPAGYEFTYVGDREAREVGNYEVYIKLNNVNYSIIGLAEGTEANPLKWSIKESENPPQPPVIREFSVYVGSTLIKVRDLDGVLPADPGFNATDAIGNYTNDYFNSFVGDGNTANLLAVFDIGFSKWSGTGNFDVEINNPAYSGKNIVLVHIHNGVAEKLNISESGGAIKFTTTGFSPFAVVESQPVTPEPEDKGSDWWIWLLVAIIILLLIIIIILVILLIKKSKEPEEVEEQPQVIVINTEEYVDGEKVEEVESEPEPEPEPEPQPEPQPEEEIAAAEVPIVIPIIDDSGRTVYDKSFKARLSQAEDNIKVYYTELKNDILSYKGVKSRISWHFDSFNKGRTKCIKLQIRGKSMYMYIALPAAELDPKYHVKDVSDKARYEAVPTMLKIRRPRSLKYAKQLVAMLMERIGVERGETPDFQYKPRYKSNETLIREGLIKVKTTHSTFAAPKPKDENK